jgi:hypothetical protein
MTSHHLQEDDRLEDFACRQITLDGITKTVYVAGTGPAVIIMAEMPGISPHVARFARWVRDVGLTVYMPSLFGRDGAVPEAEASAGEALPLRGVRAVCGCCPECKNATGPPTESSEPKRAIRRAPRGLSGRRSARPDYLILASLKATCFRMTGSYFFSSIFSGVFRLFFEVV